MDAIDMNGRLAGKVALVTGGSSGIGRAIAQAMAREGAAVSVFARTNGASDTQLATDDLIRQAGGRARFISGSVTDAAAINRAVAETLETFGDLDIVLHSAGDAGPVGDSRDIDVAAFTQTLSVNLTGFLLLAQAGLRHFVPKGAGRVIAISSNFGAVGVAGMASYCASKGAINNLVRALAVEYGKYGITVNALCPGSTRTPMSAPHHADPGIAAAFRAMTPLRLPGDAYQAEPEDIAPAAVYLASDESRFMTGTEMIVDGGWNAW